MSDRELQCAAQHFGLWCVHPRWMNSTVAAYNAGALPKVAVAENGTPLYTVDESGIAYVSINGQLTKGQSSYGGTSNVRTRQALRGAEADSDVKGIMLLIDSPGGTVAGQKAMSDEIARIAKSGRVPIVAHAEDAMHSAALWAGVQAQRVTASEMTEIGSIGVVVAVHDYSKMYESEGVKVHVVSTGDMKGAFAPGTEVTDEQLAELQARVDQINRFFLDAVKRGRGMAIDDVRALADGRDWMATDAKDKGLIDEVMSQDDAVRTFRAMIRQRERESQSRASNRARRAAIAKLK